MADGSNFILASASPRRLALLAQIGIVPEQVIAAEIDETSRKNELLREYVNRLALEKARTVAALHPGKRVLAADTAVACGRRILPKAETQAQALECLRLLSGRRHRVYTAVALREADGRETARLSLTHVKFKRLTAREMEAYAATGEWMGKAGGYAIQGAAAAFIPWINGSFDNVVGLPLHDVTRLLHG